MQATNCVFLDTQAARSSGVQYTQVAHRLFPDILAAHRVFLAEIQATPSVFTVGLNKPVICLSFQFFSPLNFRKSSADRH